MNGKFSRAFGIYAIPFFNDGISPESSEEISVCFFLFCWLRFPALRRGKVAMTGSAVTEITFRTQRTQSD